MSNLFSKPTLQAPSTPPPAPTVANSQMESDIAARQMAERTGRGRTSTMFTGGAGLSKLGTTSKVLLGR